MLPLLYPIHARGLLCLPWALSGRHHPWDQYDGCIRTARYGLWEGPALFCQDHKRVGMYTFRDGQWMRATKDGNGEFADELALVSA